MNKRRLTYKGMVYPWHCDHMGHMNVMWYVSKFDEATWAFFASIGLTPASLRADNRGMAALEQHVAYRREALPGDMLEIHTHLVEIKAKTIRFAHQMTDAQSGQVLAECEMTAIYLDTEARKGVALPKIVHKMAAALG